MSRTALTEYANQAVTELFQLQFVCRSFSNRVRANEQELIEGNAKHPDSPPITNQAFNDAASGFLGSFQLCRAVDLYNWYCRECLKLALRSDPQSVIGALKTQPGDFARAVAKAEKNGKDPSVELIQGFLENGFRNDAGIREAVHGHLGVIQAPEAELICICRNAVVHQRGHDEFGKIAEAIGELGSKRSLIGATSFPDAHMPIAVGNDGYLILTDTVGAWAAELLHQQIFMMDQNFAHRYRLPRKVWSARSMTLHGPYQSSRTPMVAT